MKYFVVALLLTLPTHSFSMGEILLKMIEFNRQRDQQRVLEIRWQRLWEADTHKRSRFSENILEYVDIINDPWMQWDDDDISALCKPATVNARERKAKAIARTKKLKTQRREKQESNVGRFLYPEDNDSEDTILN